MATLIRYVNTANGVSGDGTTNATDSSGTSAFVSLSAAEAALRQTLTGVTCDVNDELGANTIALDILCMGTADDTTAVTFTNAAWVTDATHRIRVRLNGTGAGAKWDGSLYVLSAAPGYDVGTLSVGKALHITFQDLQAEATGTLDGAQQALHLSNFTWDVHVVRGFYRTTGTTGTWDNTHAICSKATGTFTLMMQNVTAVAADGRAYMQDGYTNVAAVLNCYSCTFINKATNRYVFMTLDMDTGTTTRFKNLLIQGPTGALVNYNCSAADATDTILTQDTSSPTVGLRSLTVSFVDAANWDYHLASGDTAAKNAGTDLSGDAFYVVTTDGDTVTRSGTWDVGADELSGAAPLATPGLVTSSPMRW